MRFRVVGVHPDSGEGIDMVIEAPDLPWAQRIVRQRGIVIDSIDPAPAPRPSADPVKLDRRGPDGSTLGGRALIVPAVDEPPAAVATAEVPAPPPAVATPRPLPPIRPSRPALPASWFLWSAMAAGIVVAGVVIWRLMQ